MKHLKQTIAGGKAFIINDLRKKYSKEELMTQLAMEKRLLDNTTLYVEPARRQAQLSYIDLLEEVVKGYK